MEYKKVEVNSGIRINSAFAGAGPVAIAELRGTSGKRECQNGIRYHVRVIILIFRVDPDEAPYMATSGSPFYQKLALLPSN